jgi:hypothetical protein
MRSIFFAHLLVSAMAIGAPAARASVDVGGVGFVARVESPTRPLVLKGSGVLRWRALIRAYAAALYMPLEVATESALDDVPKRLEIEYFWRIDAADFGRAADQLLVEQLGLQRVAPLRARLDALHARYESVEPGDRYALTYWPGVGTELSKNGRSLTVIPGADFASAYFGLWLGDQPIDIRLRDDLRGGSPQRARTE